MDQQKGALILSSRYSLMKSIFYMNYEEWNYCAVHRLLNKCFTYPQKPQSTVATTFILQTSTEQLLL